MRKRLVLILVVSMILSLLTAGCGLLDGLLNDDSGSNGETLYEDDFSDDSSGWEVGEYTDGWVGYAKGTYEVGATYTSSPMWGVAGQKFSDVSVTVEATQYDAPSNSNNDFGIILREQGNADGYHFLISGDGYYAIYLLEDGYFTPLVDFTTSSVIKQGDTTNTITAIANGTELTLIVNGETVASTTDSTFSSGDIGLAATTYEEEQTVIRFDNLVAVAPSGSSASSSSGKASLGSTSEPQPTNTTAPLPTNTTEPQPTNTAEPLPTNTAEPLPTNTAEPLPTDAAGGDTGTILYEDDFSNSRSGWEIGEYEDGWVGYADGTYEVGATYTGSPMWGVPDQNFSDVSVTVEATQYQSPSNSNNDLGIILREQGNADGYHFLISGDGYYAIYLLENSEFTPLVSFTASSVIKQGFTTNTITAIANGTELTLIVNGQTVASITDSTFSSGNIGLAVTSYEEDSAVIRFDNLVAVAP